MKTQLSLLKSIFILLLAGITSCSSPQLTPTAKNTESPEPTTPATQIDTPTATAEPADVIFFNGALVTIDESQPTAEAIAIRDGLIQAVGLGEEVLALQGSDTVIIDLQGHALMPGFIDGHTHILAFPGRKGKTLDEAQDVALRYGFTGLNEMWADNGYLDQLMQAEQAGSLRLRVNVFVSYNDGILDANHQKVFLKTWYPAHPPILDPTRFLRIPGIKIFVDGDNFQSARGCWALRDPFEPGAPALTNVPCGTARGDLYWTQDELNQVVVDAQAAGYSVAFHAMGDGAIELALNAIEVALDGQSDEVYRHQIEHNSLAAPDQLMRYADMHVLASVRGYGAAGCEDLSFLLPNFGAERMPWYANRYSLATMVIHSYMETDFGWTIDPDNRFAQRALDPIMGLYGMVTHNFVAENGSICEPDPLLAAHIVSVERALQMMTIEPAYAVSMEDYLGSLEPGKYADLIVLSESPLAVAPDELKDLQVWMTMVAGNVEYCGTGREEFCPSAIPPEAQQDLLTSGNLAMNQAVTASSSSQFASEFAVDDELATSWGAGDFAPQWIEIDLGAPATITGIRLLTSQSPDGDTVHLISVRSEGDDFFEVYRFEKFTRDGEWQIFTPDVPLENIRVVRIETTESPSWVAWAEIQILGNR
jgi:hypothetical protein